MSEGHFAAMRRIVKQLFPKFSARQTTYACNKVSQAIRKWKGDCYAVELDDGTGKWLGSDTGHYFHHFDVKVGGRTLYGRIAID